MQQRLAALHHLDGPWRPSDVEQRNGRILRPMNMFDEVSVFIYITEQSFDVYVWQILESKARFIAQVMSGSVTARTAEDVDDMVMTAAQVKAIATGNPQVLEKVSTELELSRLSRLYLVWRNVRRDLKWEYQRLPEKISEADQRVACHKQAVAVRNSHKQDGGAAFAVGLRHSLRNDQLETFDQRAQAGERLEGLRRQTESMMSAQPHCLGSYLGFEIFAQRKLSGIEGLFDPVEGFLRLPGGQYNYSFIFSDSAQGTIQSIDAALRKLDPILEGALSDLAKLRHKQDQIEKALSSGWEHAQRYQELQEKLRQVNQELRESGSQIDYRQAFTALDPEAFRPCGGDESSVAEPKELSRNELPPPASPEFSAAAAAGKSPALAEAGTPQAEANAEEPPPARSPLTLNDPQSEPCHGSVKRRSSSTSSTDADAQQLSLW
jgi:hypothetical protein